MNAAGQRAVDVTAERLASMVDQVLGRQPGTATGPEVAAGTSHAEDREAACSCGSGIPVTRLDIGGKSVEMVALPLIFQKFLDTGGLPDDALAHELFETVKIYNPVPEEAEDRYREAVLREYATYRHQKEKQP